MARARERGGAGGRRGRHAVGKPPAKPAPKAAAKPGAKPAAKAAGKPAPKAGLPKAPAKPERPRFKGRMLENEPLARCTTYRIGGPARYFVTPAETGDVVTALAFAAERGLPWLVLGLGSNVLIKDNGFPGVVIRLGKGMDWMHEKSGAWRIGAGMPTPLLARKTAEAGWAGVHKLIGIPGTVGGGVYMNAGCHGSEFADVVERITVVPPNGQVKLLTRKEIPFKYRTSGLKDVVVVEAELRLTEVDPAKLKTKQAALFRWRKAGTPFNLPCCGSVFRNPPPVKGRPPRTAGQLIDACDLKGFQIGGAQVSTLHGNYIINTGTATASDVLKLIDHVRKTVAKGEGVELALEVKILGQ